jgi:hypothetical protein
MINETSNTFYGLYHKNEKCILGYYKIPSESYKDIVYKLCFTEKDDNSEEDKDSIYDKNYDTPFWLHSNPKFVEWVRCNRQSTYNSCFDSPVNPFVKEDLQVIKVVKIFRITPEEIQIPNVYEYYKNKYEGKDNKQWEYTKENISKGLVKSYPYWEV